MLPIQTGAPVSPPEGGTNVVPQEPLALGTVDVNPGAAKAGASVSVKTTITGGSPPYTVKDKWDF